MPTQVVIYGAGGFARELAWLLDACNQTDQAQYEVVCFADDNESHYGSMLNGIPVMSLMHAHEEFPKAAIVGGVGSPRARQAMMERAADAGYKFETVIHPRVERSRWLDIGEGTVICAGSILTTNIRLGRHVQINLDCTIGHDVIMGDYTTLAPGVHVSGCVHMGQRVYVGTGATILNGTPDEPLVIGDDVVIGAAACVTKSISAGQTVVGVPAKPLHK